ncbi:hypothetical protein EK21DRAFT_84746 [Setomelanomma holmii]|uniref:Uncharacterized protein n=1 Tax=Setomelanomma holmii TaxID=210430 RepID=A0A9P4LS54_9PLEO|nr:hypothetical protein EK21DRAFT_84746 [Setomelanomma holmii]
MCCIDRPAELPSSYGLQPKCSKSAPSSRASRLRSSTIINPGEYHQSPMGPVGGGTPGPPVASSVASPMPVDYRVSAPAPTLKQAAKPDVIVQPHQQAQDTLCILFIDKYAYYAQGTETDYSGQSPFELLQVPCHHVMSSRMPPPTGQIIHHHILARPKIMARRAQEDHLQRHWYQVLVTRCTPRHQRTRKLPMSRTRGCTGAERPWSATQSHSLLPDSPQVELHLAEEPHDCQVEYAPSVPQLHNIQHPCTDRKRKYPDQNFANLYESALSRIAQGVALELWYDYDWKYLATVGDALHFCLHLNSQDAHFFDLVARPDRRPLSTVEEDKFLTYEQVTSLQILDPDDKPWYIPSLKELNEVRILFNEAFSGENGQFQAKLAYQWPLHSFSACAVRYSCSE